MPSGRFRFGRTTYRRAKGGLPNEQRIQLRNNVESSRTYLYDQLNPKLRPHINQPRMAAVPLTSVEILEQMIHTVDHLALTSLVEMQDVQDLLSSPSLQSVSGQDLSGSLNQGLSISDLDLAQSIVQNPSSENIQACVKAGLDMEKTVRFANSLTPETVAILNDYVDENEGSSSKPVDESLELSHYHSDNAVMVCLPKIHNLLVPSVFESLDNQALENPFSPLRSSFDSPLATFNQGQNGNRLSTTATVKLLNESPMASISSRFFPKKPKLKK